VKELVVYRDDNERRRAKELLERLGKGATVVLVSDAGMPGLSDPGYRLVRGCVESGIQVGVVPGPTASVSALAVSGLPPGRFVFEGFLPRKQGDRRRRVADLAHEERTIVVFESPHRVKEALADLLDGLGNRPAALVRELTKMFEEVRRGGLAELLESLGDQPPKGEIVLVIGGAIHDDKPKPSSEELARRARELMDAGIERKEAMARVAKETGARRREVFEALIEPGD
jgi:16S rRNA (cytidine1402-2'-O)-methyltransferase